LNPLEPVLLEGKWQEAASTGDFSAINPASGEVLPRRYPISSWSDCDRALNASASAAEALREVEPEVLAQFLESYAAKIEAAAVELSGLAAEETALPLTPRLKDVELPRTVNQLRQAAAAAREGSWKQATIDSAANIRSYFAPLGPIVTIGPNNFPFAFNGASGGDFAAAVAAGNPVIIKAHPAHPRTTQRLAELAFEAVQQCGLPAATVQLLYRVSHSDGARLVSDPRVGGAGFTGGRTTGMQLKAAADRAGKPIYLEMSSINPVVILSEHLPSLKSFVPVA
jgi:alpha-ketoglutaric semialdehyde dehydrogenase